jgi:anti-anti-sigma factor
VVKIFAKNYKENQVMVEYFEEDGKLRCAFQGAMDTAACGKMAEALYARIDTARLPIVFDMQGVEFMASAFFRICLTVGKKAGGDKFSIINLSPMCKRMFKIAGLDRIFAIAE